VSGAADRNGRALKTRAPRRKGRARGRARRGAERRAKNRHCLDEPAGVCYCFSELNVKALVRVIGAGYSGFRDSRETKWGAKPLKTNNSAKWPISRPSMISRTYDRAAKRSISLCETSPSVFAGFSAPSRSKTQGARNRGRHPGSWLVFALPRDSEMAPQATGIAQNGRGNGVAGSQVAERERISMTGAAQSPSRAGVFLLFNVK